MQRFRASDRRGFALIELIAALAIGALVVSGAWRTLTLLGEVQQALSARRVTADAAANGLRVLRALVLRAEAGPDSSHQFAGTSTAVAFGSWCAAPGGWLEPCRVALEASRREDSTVVVVSRAGHAPLRLWATAGPAEFRYVDVPHHDRWDASWIAGITPPAAVVIVTLTDSLVFRVGASP